MKRIYLCLILAIFFAQAAWAGRAKVDVIARDPYISAMVIDADTGKVLFEDHAEQVVYPASVLKVMDLLVILEQVEQQKVKLDDLVQVTKEASQMGGSQVYLDPKEQFTVQDLLFALAVQSANDAAVALATHVAGSPEGFVAMMNQRAQQLGMKDTHFYSVHGLPPSAGQQVDQTTARDLSVLSRELAKKPEIFEYTGARERPFRGGTFVMRNHNHLLGMVDGCDGFKTGYFEAAGFSIVTTAKRGGVRIIAIVMGSKDRKVRDAKAAELLAKGFSLVPPKPEAVAAISKPQPAPAPAKEAQAVPSQPMPAPPPETEKVLHQAETGGWGMFFWGLAAGLALLGIPFVFLSRRPAKKGSKLGGLQ